MFGECVGVVVGRGNTVGAGGGVWRRRRVVGSSADALDWCYVLRVVLRRVVEVQNIRAVGERCGVVVEVYRRFRDGRLPGAVVLIVATCVELLVGMSRQMWVGLHRPWVVA